MSPVLKAYRLLTPPEQRGAVLLVGLMVLGAGLETVGVGAIIPVMALLMQGDIGARYPLLQSVLVRLGNPGPSQLATLGMLALTGIYFVKTVFLGFLVEAESMRL